MFSLSEFLSSRNYLPHFSSSIFIQTRNLSVLKSQSSQKSIPKSFYSIFETVLISVCWSYLLFTTQLQASIISCSASVPYYSVRVCSCPCILVSKSEPQGSSITEQITPMLKVFQCLLDPLRLKCKILDIIY